MIQGLTINDITVDFLKSYLRLDEDDDSEDMLLATLIMAGKSTVESYVNRPLDSFTKIPDEFAIALLALCSHWYENRAITADKYSSTTELPFMVKGLLQRHRKSAIGAGLNGTIK